jgi:ribosome-binding factor A
MASSIRIKRLEKQALQTASKVVLFEMHDPRLQLVTLTRVKLTSDLSFATIYWSSLDQAGSRTKIEHALNSAAGHVQRAIAVAFSTRRSPRVTFQFDKSIEGAIRVTGLIEELNVERAEREVDEAEDTESDPEHAPGDEPAPKSGDDSIDLTEEETSPG